MSDVILTNLLVDEWSDAVDNFYTCALFGSGYTTSKLTFLNLFKNHLESNI